MSGSGECEWVTYHPIHTMASTLTRATKLPDIGVLGHIKGHGRYNNSG